MGRWWVAATAALVLATARAAAAPAPSLAASAPAPPTPAAAAEQYGILTPPPPPQPRVNGPRIFGVRPGRPVLFKIAASGERPLVYGARGLPEGLRVDPVTGAVTGRVAAAGEYVVTLEARSAAGLAARPMRLVVGDRIALAPPMGWNAWNCWSTSVDDRKIRQAADAMVRSGLADHGWAYINIDDGWQGRRTPPEYALQPKAMLPDMKALADYVHGLGLKIGLYSTPWKTSYAGYPGGSADTDDGRILAKEHRLGAVAFEAADARQFAAWGIDYLKYDWKPNDVPHAAAMAEALRACGRDIVFSLSNAASLPLAPRWAEIANAWRTTGDMEDSWESVSGIGFAQDPWRPFAGPGHWSDPDMLVVGHVGWGPKLRPTELTPNEQYAHVSLWCLLAAPLLLGCDLETLDPFTLALLVNDEVLAVNQDPLGRQAARLRADGPLEVWAKDLEDGSKAVGLFNRADDAPRTVTVRWSDLNLVGRQRVRDLWRQRNLGDFEGEFAARVLVHGVVLVRIAPEPSP